MAFSFRNASLKRKQTLLMVTIAGVSLVLSGGGLMFHGLHLFRESLRNSLVDRAGVIAGVSTAALEFGDVTAAREILQSLKADPDMTAGALYNAANHQFAHYVRHGAADIPPPVLTGSGELVTPDMIAVWRPVVSGEEAVGFVYLQSDLTNLHTYQKKLLLTGAALLGVSLCIAFALAAYFQRFISLPVKHLLTVARSVADQKDFSLRAIKHNDDELGRLVDGFNGMLEQIQSRDAELKQNRDLLERRVDDRTAQLQEEILRRQRIEIRLQSSLRSLAAFRAVLDRACGISTTDLHGTITSANENLCALSGYTAEELIGRHYSILRSDHHSDAFYEDLNATITHGGVWRGEIKNRGKTGQEFWVNATIGPLLGEGGRPNGYLAVRIDISERKRQEEELQHARGFLNSVIENLPIPVFIKDARDLRFILWNKAGEQLTGISNDEMVGRNDYDMFSHADADMFTERDRAVLTSGTRMEFPEEILNTRHRGSRITRVTKVPIQGSDGEPAYLLGIAEDITERKRAETEFAEMNKRLLEFSRQAGQAEVATAVLHNVGNVLNSVNVSATLLDDRLRKAKTPGFVKVVALLRENAADLPGFFSRDPRAGQLLVYLESFAQHLSCEQQALSAEVECLRKNIGHIKEIVSMQQCYAKISGNMEAVAPSELVGDALRINAGVLKQHGIEVIREIDEAPPVEVDKNKVLQILVNFLRNACHACDDSGRSDKRITVRVARLTDRVRFSVADNGIGIPAANLTRIFSHGFTTRRDGHGFGLHSGANAARELGGSVSVQSAGPGLGAEFTLELPVGADHPRLGP